MLQFNHRGDVSSATYISAVRTLGLDFDTQFLELCDHEETATALEKIRAAERGALLSEDLVHIDTASTQPRPNETAIHASSRSLSDSSSDNSSPALSDSATISSGHTESILTPEQLSPPRLETKVLKSEEELILFASPCHLRPYPSCKEAAKASPANDVKERIRALLQAKNEASFKKAYEQAAAMAKKNEQRRTE